MTRTAFQPQILQTPFHARTSAASLANEWTTWAGYTTPNVLSSTDREYFAIRNAASLFDLSPMVKYDISGPDATAFLDRLLTRNVAKIAPGRVAYAIWCNDAGMVIDDSTLFHLNAGNYRLCAQERSLPWLLDTALGFEVTIRDVSPDIAALALQGPTSCAVLKSFGLPGIENLKPYAVQEFTLDNKRIEVSRTGFTGDLGYEIWGDPSHALWLWDRLMTAGQLYGIQPIGSAALDMARIEAGFIVANVDFFAGNVASRPNRLRSPFELGLGWLVDLKKGHFVGRRALLRERETGSRYGLVGLDIDGNKPATDAFIYSRKNKQVGVVTSALWSPSAKRNIAIASLQVPYDRATDGLRADVYVKRELQWDRIAAPCRIVDKRFFNPPRRWATPAADK